MSESSVSDRLENGAPNGQEKEALGAEEALHETWFYDFCAYVQYLPLKLFFRLQFFGREEVPADGGFVLASNHQCFLDPIFLGLGMKRQLHFMTRASAFEIPIIGAFIKRVNAFPVERGQADVGALKHAIQMVRAGGGLLIFPEGTRTRDGRIGKIKPGAVSIAQKTGGLVVPAAIRGAHAAWPRQKKFPALGRVSIGYGPAFEVGSSKDDLVLAAEKLDREIRRIYEELEEKRPGHVEEF